MSVYSNTDIKKAIATGHIVFHPYQEEHIAGSSVDVTLGHYFYKQEYPEESKVYNPFDKKEVDSYFKGPLEAMPHKEWCKKHGYLPFKNIPDNHPIIVLKPGERILGHTHEFIGIKAPGTSTMQARSTWGRNGVAVCLDAGWGDPGYINRWTMEIYNMNEHESVVLPVGERIAQLVFYETGPVEKEYKKLSGKYQGANSSKLEDIIANWSPEQMLPRAYKDSRRTPTKIKGLPEGMK
jgi:deoxycytidine triphosphate deaminase|tara:strand:- start:938 stop:1648 length:711 start_codon:yes stop_codon:yes gene_type:complete